MLSRLLKSIGMALLVLVFLQAVALAQGGEGGQQQPANPQEASFKSRCANAKNLQFPECASSPSECISSPMGPTGNQKNRVPFNCIFLQEPLGGRTGYDLFKITPANNGNIYTLWFGEAIVGQDSGPVQAVLAFEVGKETQGPFGLLYNYLGLVYNFLSGIIIAFVVLVVIIGGIQMTTSAGNQDQFTKGRSMIQKALIGMVIWFLASVILYTINPTFFAF